MSIYAKVRSYSIQACGENFANMSGIAAFYKIVE